MKFRPGLWILFVAAALGLFLLQQTLTVSYLVVFQWLTRTITRDAVVSPYVAAAVASVFAVVLVTTLRSLASFDRQERRTALYLLAGEATVYFSMLAFATRNHNVLNVDSADYLMRDANGCYVVVYTARNPLDGSANEPLSDENRHLIGCPPKRVIVDATTRFVDGADRPLLWWGYGVDGKVEFFDKEGVHPQTRERLQAPTPEIIRHALGQQRVEIEESTLSQNRPRKVVITPRMQLVNADNTPLYWYALTPGRLELFDRDGFHPETGERLRPVTPVFASTMREALLDSLADEQGNLTDYELYLRKYADQMSSRTGK